MAAGTHALDEHQLMQKMLKLVKLFDGFSEQDARDFLAWAKRCDVKPGERVIAEGEPGHDMYIVVIGEVKVVKTRAGVEEELALLGAGDSFGEVALIDSGARSASVIATRPSMLLRFERRMLVKIPQVSLKLYRSVAAMMASRLRDTSTRVMLARCAETPADLADEVPLDAPARQVARG